MKLLNCAVVATPDTTKLFLQYFHMDICAGSMQGHRKRRHFTIRNFYKCVKGWIWLKQAICWCNHVKWLKFLIGTGQNSGWFHCDTFWCCIVLWFVDVVCGRMWWTDKNWTFFFFPVCFDHLQHLNKQLQTWRNSGQFCLKTPVLIPDK